MADDEEILKSVKSSVDFSIVVDNIFGISDYVIEKYEYKHGVKLTDAQREQANARIKDALWSTVEELKLQRLSVLQDMFSDAEGALEEVMGKTG